MCSRWLGEGRFREVGDKVDEREKSGQEVVLLASSSILTAGEMENMCR